MEEMPTNQESLRKCNICYVNVIALLQFLSRKYGIESSNGVNGLVRVNQKIGRLWFQIEKKASS